jgi:hypothetical protein
MGARREAPADDPARPSAAGDGGGRPVRGVRRARPLRLRTRRLQDDVAGLAPGLARCLAPISDARADLGRLRQASLGGAAGRDPSLTTTAPGTDRGLAVARGVVDRHGGAVGVRSQVGKGTALALRLPLATRADPAAAAC